MSEQLCRCEHQEELHEVGGPCRDRGCLCIHFVPGHLSRVLLTRSDLPKPSAPKKALRDVVP